MKIVLFFGTSRIGMDREPGNQRERQLWADGNGDELYVESLCTSCTENNNNTIIIIIIIIWSEDEMMMSVSALYFFMMSSQIIRICFILQDVKKSNEWLIIYIATRTTSVSYNIFQYAAEFLFKCCTEQRVSVVRCHIYTIFKKKSQSKSLLKLRNLYFLKKNNGEKSS